MNIYNPQQQSEVSLDAFSEIEGILEKKELRPRTNLAPGVFQEYKRTYVKVPTELKDQLSQMVFKEGFKIKDAAKQLNIKYATAKTIVFHLRKSSQSTAMRNRKTCRYTQFSQKLSSKLKIISKTSNQIVSSQDYILQQLQSE